MRRLAPLLLIGLALARPAAGGGFCSAHPLDPPCCPTPCPIEDSTKLASMVEDAADAVAIVGQCRQGSSLYVQWIEAIGQGGTLSGASRNSEPVEAAILALSQSTPNPFAGPDPANLGSVIAAVKTGLFPGPAPSVTAARSLAQTQQATEGMEMTTALVSAFDGFARLPAISQDGARQTSLAAAGMNLRQDLAANSAARQAFLANLSGMTALLTAWAATQAMEAEAAQTGAGAMTAVPIAVAPPAPAPASSPAAARIAAMEDTAAALSDLHNNRYQIQLLQSQIPPLQSIEAGARTSEGFAQAEASRAIGLLGPFSSDPASSFQGLARMLRANDPTVWTESGIKAAAAGSAVAEVLAAFQGQAGADSLEPLGASLAAWLEDDKQSRAWQTLASDAGTVLSGIYARLAALKAAAGPDPAQEEQALLARLSAQQAALPTMPGSPSAGAADPYRALAGAIAADPAASRPIFLSISE